MKKILRVLLATVILLVSLNISPDLVKDVYGTTRHYSQDGNWEYLLDDDGSVRIQAYIGTEPNVYVPSMIDGHQINSIGEKALMFYTTQDLNKLTMSESITDIWSSALAMSNFEQIIMPSYVDTLAWHSCEDNTDLVHLTLPDNLIAVPLYTCNGCTSLLRVDMPRNAQIVKSYAFSNCTSLKEIVMPENLTTIENYAFKSSTSLKKITIYDEVTNIGEYAFSGCNYQILEIHGYSGSYAETYADAHNITFVPLDDPDHVRDNEFVVRVYDNTNNSPVEGANVHIDGFDDQITDSDGRVVFVVPDNFQQSAIKKNIQITKGEYYTTSTKIMFQRGTLQRKYLQYDDGQFHVLEFVHYRTYFDLVHNTKVFYADDPDSTSEKYLWICVGPNTNFEKYRIDGWTTDTNYFNIDFAKDCIPNRVITTQVFGDTSISELVELGVIVYPETPDLSDKTINLFPSPNTTISCNIPVLGGSQLKPGVQDYLTIAFDVDEDGTIKAWIETGTGVHEDQYDAAYRAAKHSYQDLSKIKYNPSYTPKHANLDGAKKLNTHSAFDLYWDVYAAGYGEGYLRDDGTIWIDEFKILLGARVGAEKSWVFFVPSCAIPFYARLEGNVEAEGITTWTSHEMPDGSADFDCTEFTLGLRIALTAGGGAGIPDFATIGVNVRAELDVLTDPIQQITRMDLTVGANVEASISIFKLEHNLAKTSFNLVSDNGYFSSSLERKTTDNQTHISSAGQTDLSIKAGKATENNMVCTTAMYQSTNYTVSQRTAQMSTNMVYGNNIDVIEANTFENAMPQMVYHNGDQYVFWLADNTNRAAQDRTMLVYSKLVNGVWSVPVAIDDDGTADGYFEAESDGTGIGIVWQDTKIQHPVDVTMENFFKQGEINFVYLDTITDTLSSVTQVTNDLVMDTIPAIGYYGGTLNSYQGKGYITWVSNSNNNIFLNSGTNTIYRIPITNCNNLGSIETSYTTTNPVVELEAGSIISQATAFVIDEDNNLETLDDREIYIHTSSGNAYNFTNNNTYDGNIVFAKLGTTTPYLFWYSDSSIYSVNSFRRGIKKVSGNYEVPAEPFEVLDNANYSAKIIWAQPIITDGVASQDIYAIENWGVWSDPYLMTNISAGSTLPTGFYDYTNGYCQLFYLESNGNTKDLITETVDEKCEIEIFDIRYRDMVYIDYNHYLYADYINTGSNKITSYDMELYRNDVLYYSVSKTAATLPGKEGLAMMTYNDAGFALPLDTTPNDVFRVELTCSDGVNTCFDSYEFQIIYPDVEMDLERSYNNGKYLVTVNATNNTLIDTEGTVVFREGNADGNILYETELGTISKDYLTTMTTDLSRLANKTTENMIYVEVVSSQGDVLLSNNFDRIPIPPELQNNTVYEPIEVSSNVTNCISSTASDGVIELNVTKGSGEYKYSSDGGLTWQNSNVFNNLVCGVYKIVVMDCYYDHDIYFETITIETSPLQSVTIDSMDDLLNIGGNILYYNATDGIILTASSLGSGGNAGTDETVLYKFYYSTDNEVTWTECADWGSHEITFLPTSGGDYSFYVQAQAIGNTVVVDSAVVTKRLQFKERGIQSITIFTPEPEYYNASEGITISATVIDGYGNVGTAETVGVMFRYSPDAGQTWVTLGSGYGPLEITFYPPTDGEYKFKATGTAINSSVYRGSGISSSTMIYLEEKPIQSVTITDPDAQYYNAGDGITLSASSVDGYGNAGTDTTVEYKFYYSTDDGVTWTECAAWSGHEITFTPTVGGNYIFYAKGRAQNSTVEVSSTQSTQSAVSLEEKPIQSVTITDPDAQYYNAGNGITLSASSVDGYGNAGTDTTVEYKFYYSTDDGVTWTECDSVWGGHEITFTPTVGGDYIFYAKGRAQNSTVELSSTQSTQSSVSLEEKPIQSVTITDPDAQYYNAGNGITLSASSVDGYGNAGTDTTVEYKFYYSTDDGVTWTECDSVWGGHGITFTPSADDTYIFYAEGRAIGSTVVVNSSNSTATDLYLGPQP